MPFGSLSTDDDLFCHHHAVGKAPEKPRRASDAWDEGYDHALQQELILLVLVAVEQVLAMEAQSYPFGQVSPEAGRLLDETRQALERGIAAMVPGNRISDIGAAIEAHVTPFGYGIVRDYVGHGIGKKLHEDPQVPNYGPAQWARGQPNPRLRPGMVLVIPAQ